VEVLGNQWRIVAYQEEKGRHSSKLVAKCNSFPETQVYRNGKVFGSWQDLGLGEGVSKSFILLEDYVN